MPAAEVVGCPDHFQPCRPPREHQGVGRLPIVVTPTIRNIKVGRVLIDGGSGLNILSPRLFEKMQIPHATLRPSMPFYSISPGASTSLGQVDLAVTFGSPDNFRTEMVTFDVPHFEISYNAILGRPLLAKFMVSAHYAYMVIKMPRPQCPITVPIDMEGAMRCVDLVHTAAVADQPPREQPELAQSRTRIAASDAGPIKEILLDADPTKTVKIGGSLDPK